MTFRPDAANSLRPDERQLAELLAELRSVADDFELGILDRSRSDGKRWSLTAAQLMARAKVAARAERAGSGTPSYGADGSRNGPTPAQALTVSDERKAWDEWLVDLQVAMTYLRHAASILDRATPAQQRPDRPDLDACRVCSRPGKPEAVYASERCQWCWRFWRLWGVDAPEPILKLRREGRAISENAIRWALDEELAG